MTNSTSTWVGCLLLSVGALSSAQPKEQVLKGEQLTESAVIDMLHVEQAQPTSGAQRGFRPTLRTPMDRPAGPGRASLLITFPTDSAELPPESQAAIDVVARALQSDRLAGLSFKVEGHADPRGSVEHNLRLSQLRAEAVVSYLVAQHGILAERLTPLGKGSAEPLDAARPEAAENRRVTIVTERE